MQRLEVSGAVRPIYESLGVKRLNTQRGWHTSELCRSNVSSLRSECCLVHLDLSTYHKVSHIPSLCCLKYYTQNDTALLYINSAFLFRQFK